MLSVQCVQSFSNSRFSGAPLCPTLDNHRIIIPLLYFMQKKCHAPGKLWCFKSHLQITRHVMLQRTRLDTGLVTTGHAPQSARPIFLHLCLVRSGFIGGHINTITIYQWSPARHHFGAPDTFPLHRERVTPGPSCEYRLSRPQLRCFGTFFGLGRYHFFVAQTRRLLIYVKGTQFCFYCCVKSSEQQI